MCFLTRSRRALVTAVHVAALVVGTPWSWQAACGQVTGHFDFALESPEFPELDETLTIDAPVGERVAFAANLIIASAGIDDEGSRPPGPPAGFQGWSLAVWSGGVDIESLSIDGTVSAPEREGGLGPDFLVFEGVDPSVNDGREGVMQAVVLGFTRVLILPPNSRANVGRIHYGATVSDPGVVAFIRYENGIRGRGQPVLNVATFQGSSVPTGVASREVTIGPNAAREICDDGIDNDRDGWTDGNDPGCRPPRADEICDDGVDNDGDGQVDCEDAACLGILPCAAPESCRDRRDNDGDGLIDCDDLDCAGRPACQGIERCRDGIDNDDDGRVDCDDSDCAGRAECRDPEDCDDGIDNDEDGDTDCDDSECRGVGDCPSAERCDDGIDNDRDGRVDCDDPDCKMVAVCRELERCRDGRDNDRDGLLDCDDPDCDGYFDCPPREVCDNGLDDDGDGDIDCNDWSCATREPCVGDERGFNLVLAAEEDRMETGAGAGAVVEPRGLGANAGSGLRNVLDVAYETERDIEVVAYIVPFPGPQDNGAQGWSISVAHTREAMDIVDVTTEGTDADTLFSGGFEKTETGNDAGGDGGGASGGTDGFVSGVVLSFTQPITLDPTIAQSIARATYTLRDNLGTEDLEAALVRFADGLRGSGQPVANTITVEGDASEPIHLVPLEIRRVGSLFVRGDLNDDGRVNLADAVWSLNELMRDGPPTRCLEAADVNDDGRHDLADPVYLVQYRFLGGPTIPYPYPQCGADPQGEALGCEPRSVANCAQSD